MVSDREQILEVALECAAEQLSGRGQMFCPWVDADGCHDFAHCDQRQLTECWKMALMMQGQDRLKAQAKAAMERERVDRIAELHAEVQRCEQEELAVAHRRGETYNKAYNDRMKKRGG